LSENLSTLQVAEETGIPAATLRYWRHADQGQRASRLVLRLVVAVASFTAGKRSRGGLPSRRRRPAAVEARPNESARNSGFPDGWKCVARNE
jgi:hypothetical protein